MEMIDHQMIAVFDFYNNFLKPSDDISRMPAAKVLKWPVVAVVAVVFVETLRVLAVIEINFWKVLAAVVSKALVTFEVYFFEVVVEVSV
jgi:hypothetical protein